METINLGRVAFVYKGDYSALTTYNKMDVVFDGESSFVSQIDNNVGNALVNGLKWKYLSRGNNLELQEAKQDIVALETDLNILDIDVYGGIRYIYAEIHIENLTKLNRYIDNTLIWRGRPSDTAGYFTTNGAKKIRIVGNYTTFSQYAFLSSISGSGGIPAQTTDGILHRIELSQDTGYVDIPDGTNYIYVDLFTNYSRFPSLIEIINESNVLGVIKDIDNEEARAIGVETVLREDIDKIPIPYHNLFDKSVITDNTQFISSNNGATKYIVGWAVSDYILLKANTTYYGYGYYVGYFYCVYDINKNVITSPADYITQISITTYAGKIIVGNNDVYFRCSWNKQYNNPYISEYSSNYIPYGEYDYSYKSPYLLKTKTLIGSKVLIISDSISAYNYKYYNKWVQCLQNDGFIPSDANNNSTHGTGFVSILDGSAAGQNFNTRVRAVINPSEYDYVVVFGGVNDYRSNKPFGTNTDDINTYFIPAVNSFFGYVCKNFINASIMVVTPLYQSVNGANTVGKSEDDYINYIKTVASSYHLPILNAHSDSGFYPEIAEFKNAWTNEADGLHPNADFSKNRLAPLFRSFIEQHLKYKWNIQLWA